MLGIKGYDPKFYSSLAELVLEQNLSLRSLMGKPFISGWVVWSRKFDSWFTEWPVVLNFGDCHLELCVWDLDKLAITWNSIDLLQPLFEDNPDADDHLEWRENALPVFNVTRNKPIQSIQLIEYRYTVTVLQDKPFPSLVNQSVDFGWLLNGIKFEFEQGFLSVQNIASGHSVTRESPTGNDYRKTSI